MAMVRVSPALRKAASGFMRAGAAPGAAASSPATRGPAPAASAAAARRAAGPARRARVVMGASGVKSVLWMAANHRVYHPARPREGEWGPGGRRLRLRAMARAASPHDTPVMQQYARAKREHPDCMVFFR